MLANDALDEVLARARDVATRIAAPQAQATDDECRWPSEAIRALQASGLGGLVAPTSAGGLGHGLFALARVGEELGRACASTAICFGMHCVGTAVIAAKATADQRERYLVPIAQGKHLTTIALSEPGTGSQLYVPETTLRRDSDDAFIVEGTKSFATSGPYADSMVVSVAAEGKDVAPGSFSCLVIPTHADGLEWVENKWSGWGMRGNAACTARLRGAKIPTKDLLGREGDQIWYLFNVVVPYFLMSMAGTYVGLAAAGLDEARKHLIERKYSHTGSTLSGKIVVQHRLGTLWAQVERTRRLIYHAAMAGDAGADDALPLLCTAKAEVAECAVHVLGECMALTGGSGYRAGSALQRRIRDAHAAHVMSPTTDMLRTWTGRALLGLPILGDE
jgi:alkylation response protein AidB-like acyl-CoA dehydrogenase